MSFLTPSVPTIGRGRPRYDVPRHQLINFVENGLTCKKISEMLDISQRTVRRRMSEFNISVQQLYSNIPDSELKQMIFEAHISFPNALYRFICGWLMQKGLKVQEQRVRVLMHEVDPVGIGNLGFSNPSVVVHIL